VRIAIMPGGGSGIEQEIVDSIANRFDGDPSIIISTVNPDWFVLCNVHESNDQVSGSIRYNGTVTIKTSDGQVVSTVAVQKYNQDFSLQPGAPLNKKLVDSAARDVVGAISERAYNQLRDAIQTELQSRDEIIKAETLAGSDKYDDAIAVLSGVGPDTVHFKAVQKRLAQFQVEKRALESIQAAEAKAKTGHYTEAVASLKEVDPKSKRYKSAMQLAAKYRAEAVQANIAKRKPVAVKPSNAHTTSSAVAPQAINKPHQTTASTPSSLGGSNKIDALIQVEKQALQERKQQIEKEQQALTKPPIGDQ
jgi:hypothetical protein